MQFDVRGLKTWVGTDGGGYQGYLVVDGKRACWFHEEGNGSQTNIDVLDAGLWEAFEAYVRKLPPVEFYGRTLPMSPETALGDLVDKHENAKRIKRWCKKSVVFALYSRPDVIFTLAKQYSEGDGDRLRERHGDDLRVVYNESGV